MNISDVQSNTGQGENAPYRLNCPNCGTALSQAAMAGGERVARCRGCGQLIHRVSRVGFPATLGMTAQAGVISQSQPIDVLEVRNAPPYPALLCVYCETSNTPNGLSQQFCTNCGNSLKKLCLNCGTPLSMLDNFCTVCRTDQEQLKYTREATVWQRFNEGKRLAKAGRWDDAFMQLAPFFEPNAVPLEPDEERFLRQTYATSIAPKDEGIGLRLFNEAKLKIRQARQLRTKALKQSQVRRRVIMALIFALIPLFMAVVSVQVFGSPWIIFFVVPLAMAVLALIFVFVLGGVS